MISLRKQLAKALKEVDKEIKQKVIIAAEEIGGSLVEQATVDTGLFAANYKVGIDEVRKDHDDYADFGFDSNKVRHREQIRIISEEQAKETATNIPSFELGQEIIWSNSAEHVGPALANIDNPFDPFSDADAGLIEGVRKAKGRVE